FVDTVKQRRADRAMCFVEGHAIAVDARDRIPRSSGLGVPFGVLAFFSLWVVLARTAAAEPETTAPPGHPDTSGPDATGPSDPTVTTPPDLKLHSEPPKMKMRAKPVVAVAPKPKQVAAEGDASVTFKAFPSSLRDLGERVTFRINAGVELDSAPASGE